MTTEERSIVVKNEIEAIRLLLKLEYLRDFKIELMGVFGFIQRYYEVTFDNPKLNSLMISLENLDEDDIDNIKFNLIKGPCHGSEVLMLNTESIKHLWIQLLNPEWNIE